MKDLYVVIGAGSIGQAIVRRMSQGKEILLADLRPENTEAAAKILRDAGFVVTTTQVDVSSRESIQALVKIATSLGPIKRLTMTLHTRVSHSMGIRFPVLALPISFAKLRQQTINTFMKVLVSASLKRD